MNPKEIKISAYDYPLPDERIARHPLEQRDDCLLLCSEPDGSLSHHRFHALPALLSRRGGVFLAGNDTRVINARLKMRKSTGAAIEIFLLEPHRPSEYVSAFESTGAVEWSCLVGNAKKWKEGALSMEVKLPDGSETTLEARMLGEGPGGSRIVEFRNSGERSFAEVLSAAGHIPIPPYLNRASEESDSRDYQTVYAHQQGSVAAPTAGLHFTEPLLKELAEKGMPLHRLTLHVGAGTFQPVKSESIGDHPMHTETFSVTRQFLAELSEALRKGEKVAAIGTTTVRTLESLPLIGAKILNGEKGELHVDQWEAYEEGKKGLPETAELIEEIIKHLDSNGAESLTASTSIMIAPGFPWRVTEVLVTNFHQPKSTLLLLVSSFLDREGGEDEQWRRVYAEALREPGYRFLSYGDACLFYPKERK